MNENEPLRGADPATATTIEEFAAALQALHIRAGRPSLRTLEARAREAKVPLPRSTINDALTGRRLPRQEVLTSLLEALGASKAAISSWQAAWERVQVTRNEKLAVAVQARDIGPITVQLPTKVPEALSGLPAGSASFVGRTLELEQLLASLAPAEGTSRPVAVAAVGGMAGIGKTELAIQAARTAQNRGWFPGGVLFANMRGYDADPARPLHPGHALEGFLRTLGVPGERIPSDMQGRAWLFRQVLDSFSARGWPVLVVVDDVSSAEQARPLLPSDGACKAIVTSRHRLANLDARLIDLDTLPTSQAIELLETALRLRRPADSRVSDDPDTAEFLVRMCGGLPLALQVVAARLAGTPAKPLFAMAEDLADRHHRLAELADDTDDLAAVFDLSYRHLPDIQARLFRLLSLNPGPDISTPAAAALAGQTDNETRRGLEALARAHLIESSSTYGRWRMHDLLRLHSIHHGHAEAEADQRDQAVSHLLDYYLTTTEAANAHLNPAITDPARLGFPNRERAMAWLEGEYANLAAATLAAAGCGHPAIARDLPAAMWDFMLWRRRFNDWSTLTDAAVHAARTLNDRRGQANALTNLGFALAEAGKFEEAITACQTATQIYRDTGDSLGEGRALTNLAYAYRVAGDLGRALPLYEATLADRERLLGDDHPDTLSSRNNLASAYQAAGDLQRAITLLEATLADRERLLGDDHPDSLSSRNNLAYAYRAAGDLRQAIPLYEQTLTDCQRVLGDDHPSTLISRNNLASAYESAGDLRQAIPLYEQTLTDRQRVLGDDHPSTLISRNNLASAYESAGDLARAIPLYEATLIDCQRVLGDNHPTTKVVMANLDAARQG